MSLTQRPLATAVDAVAAGQYVDIVGPHLSGRSTLLHRLVAVFRERGWEVLEVSGSNPPALLPAFDTDRSLIAVDDWDRLDAETRTLVIGSGSGVATTRVAGDSASESMRTVATPSLDAGALQVTIAKTAGVAIGDDDASNLAELTGGAVGAALRIVNAARLQGTLDVDGGNGRLNGEWLDAAGSVVEHILQPLSDRQRKTLRLLARGQDDTASGSSVSELAALGYVNSDSGELTSNLLRAWFTRS